MDGIANVWGFLLSEDFVFVRNGATEISKETKDKKHVKGDKAQNDKTFIYKYGKILWSKSSEYFQNFEFYFQDLTFLEDENQAFNSNNE